jgi:hypothetical protein
MAMGRNGMGDMAEMQMEGPPVQSAPQMEHHHHPGGAQ